MELSAKKINELINAFNLGGSLKSYSEISDGHINNTYRFDILTDEGQTAYLMQMLNTNVFKKPVELMNNIVGVTEFIRQKLIESGGDPSREVLNICFSVKGEPFYISSDNEFWRCYDFIENVHSMQTVTNSDDFKASAVAFGEFQNLLSDYPAETLTETIPDFHNTEKRFRDFKNSVNNNKSGRADTCKEETAFIMAREKDYGILVEQANKGLLPIRVSHNDTKLNNVLFDNVTNRALCVVDLDTVMPGLSLYDFGDSIRFGASTAAEDEKDLEKVHFSTEYFAAYPDGYLSSAGKALTKNEIEYLPFASRLMTLECGMRFLGDYIDGDIYFKTDYPEHNLVRARTQLKLAAEMEDNMDEMKNIIGNLCEKYKL